MSGRGLPGEAGQSVPGNSTRSSLERFTSPPAFPRSGYNADPGGPPAPHPTPHPAPRPSQRPRSGKIAFASSSPAWLCIASRRSPQTQAQLACFATSQLRSPALWAAVDSPLMRIEFLLNSAQGSCRKRGGGAARSS